jgi:SAM-dependent methyltransferase
VPQIYREDLAYVHDAGFGAFAEAAATCATKLLPRSAKRIVDVGCGSGIGTRILANAGFSVVGIEPSAAMIALARKNAPKIEFIQASAYETPLPDCDVVTAFGEVLNYHDAPERADEILRTFLRSVHAAVGTNGWLIFDILVDGHPSLDARTWTSGSDWAVLVNTVEDRARRAIFCGIEIFRETANGYRRTRESHTIRVFDARKITEWLSEVGFDAEFSTRYGDYRLLPRRVAVIARRTRT